MWNGPTLTQIRLLCSRGPVLFIFRLLVAVLCVSSLRPRCYINLSEPIGYVMHQQV
jgi:hypothetical protein